MNTSFMQATHTTRTGDVMLVSQMETDHLLNTIRFALRKMVELVPSATPVETNPYKEALYGKQSLNPVQIAELINGAMASLSPLIVEAFFRMKEIKSAKLETIYDEIHAQLEIVLARSGKLEGYKVKKLLPDGMSIRRLGELVDDLQDDIDMDTPD